ncbi:MAG: hypothetical protein KC933_23435 [Myxococcales bacterium]|nr:hypothetical protein [Myxococcales bacterium]
MKIKQTPSPALLQIAPAQVAPNAGAAAQPGAVVPGGSGAPVGHLPPAPVSHTLTNQELQQIQTFGGGVGLKGHGLLSGTLEVQKQHVVNFGIATQEEVPVLLLNRGSRSEMPFTLDLPLAQAKAARGQDVTVSGVVEKTTAGSGRVSNVHVSGVDGYRAGTWLQLSGRVETRNVMGFGGEAPPSGSWLKLDQPITMGGQAVTELFLEHRELPGGARLQGTGRLDHRSWGGVEHPKTNYVAFTGLTDQGAGEPAFDGRTFTDAQGKTLDVLSWVNPQIADIPSTIFVLDQGADKVWVGASGGFIHPDMNPFHGFRKSVAIEAPNAKDRAKIKDDADGHPMWGDQKLDLLGGWGQGPDVADGMATQWYRNPANGDLLCFSNGGIAGFHNHLDQVVRNA